MGLIFAFCLSCGSTLGSKVYFLLVSTLNSAFPVHDFSALAPDHFTREPSSAVVLGHLSGSLLGPSGGPS